MMKINSIDEYKNAVSQGHDPLSDWRHFYLPIDLRIEIQTRLFGRGNNPAVNDKFYHYCWEHRPHVCEESMHPLYVFSAVHISHILSRGAHPEMAHDPRNVNILTFEAHQQWENGNRKGMRIYEENLLVIELLKKDYGKD